MTVGEARDYVHGDQGSVEEDHHEQASGKGDHCGFGYTLHWTRGSRG
jgi:hypothetical protein